MTARRLADIPPTVFSEMSALAVRTGALNLGQGFPDVDGPPAVIAAAVEALHAGANQYAPGIGVPALRQAVARHQQRHYGLEVDPDREVVVTTGCTEAIAAALLGLVDPGDEVVVLEPYYDSYVAMLTMCGAVRRPVTLRAPDFRLDLDDLRAAVTPRTRLILLNTPHNPTGTVLTREELQAVADLAIEHDVVVVTDEVYEHLVFDDAQSSEGHIPIATLPGMWERTLTLSSAGKSYSFTGWKVGWATGPASLVQAVLAAKQWLTFTSGSPLQPAVAHALDHEPDWPRALAKDLQARRDLLCDGLAAAGLAPRVPEGTYFATTDISHLGWADGRDFCLALPERAGVVAIPTQGFYDDTEAGRQLVRWAFCKEPEVIREGVRRLAAADLAH
jgi:N-succinyldiaminopimelate aminotransferase